MVFFSSSKCGWLFWVVVRVSVLKDELGDRTTIYRRGMPVLTVYRLILQPGSGNPVDGSAPALQFQSSTDSKGDGRYIIVTLEVPTAGKR